MEPIDRGDLSPSKEELSASVTVFGREELGEVIPALLPTLQAISVDALGQDPDYLQEVLEDSDSLIVLHDENAILGFGAYDQIYVEGVGEVLEEVTKMVVKEQQGKGHGANITRQALANYPNASYFAFATQNPAEILSVLKGAPVEYVAPIDKLYSEDDDLALVSDTIVVENGFTDVDLNTGVKPGVYDGIRFGDFMVDPSDPDVMRIDNRLTELGVNKERGDGVLLVAKLRQPEVQS
jgi:hypothetical protein